jgi:transcriptional regulator with XRE-family HTH domain
VYRLPANPFVSKAAFNARVATVVRQLRESRGYSRPDMVRRTGIAESLQAQFETQRGGRGLTLHRAWLLAGALEVPLGVLTGDLPFPSHPPDPALLRAPRMHFLVQALAVLPSDAVDLLVNMAVDLQRLCARADWGEA